jgi:hypothetical protein
MMARPGSCYRQYAWALLTIKIQPPFDKGLVDELGFIETEPVPVGLFFTLMHKRHKRKITLITFDVKERHCSMVIFGKNGFVQKQEVAFAKKLLVWNYEKAAIALPDEAFISAHAVKIVDGAHIIAKNSGSNVFFRVVST